MSNDTPPYRDFWAFSGTVESNRKLFKAFQTGLPTWVSIYRWNVYESVGGWHVLTIEFEYPLEKRLEFLAVRDQIASNQNYRSTLSEKAD